MQPTERFSNRADDYAKYRPSYPPAIAERLRSAGLLAAGMPVADVGSGTGKWTQILLDAGARVFAVEPNEPMRREAEGMFRGNPLFTSVAGTAEATGLADASVDLITAAQAFHWFDVPKVRGEFRRILRPGGAVALIWHDRVLSSVFMRDLHELLRRHSAEYRSRPYPQISREAIAAFYSPAELEAFGVGYEQVFDAAGLIGRINSSSYAPAEPAARAAMEADLRKLFEKHQNGGTVTMTYETRLYFARVK